MSNPITIGDKPSVLMSREGIERLRQRVIQIQESFGPAKAELGDAAREDPDLPENTRFKEAKTNLQFILPQLLADTAELLDRAVPIEDTPDYIKLEDFRVGIGSEVVITLSDSPEPETWIILGPSESDPDNGILSYVSPLAAALIGLAVGETIEFRGTNVTVDHTRKALGEHGES